VDVGRAVAHRALLRQELQFLVILVLIQLFLLLLAGRWGRFFLVTFFARFFFGGRFFGWFTRLGGGFLGGGF